MYHFSKPIYDLYKMFKKRVLCAFLVQIVILTMDILNIVCKSINHITVGVYIFKAIHIPNYKFSTISACVFASNRAHYT